MKKLSVNIITVFLLDIFLLVIGFFCIESIIQKPTLYIADFDSKEFIQNCLYKNDKILKIDKFTVSESANYEIILDHFVTGQNVVIELLRNNDKIRIDYKLINYYDFNFVVITSIVSLFFLIPAFFIYFRIEDRAVAIAFHSLMLSVVIMLLFTYGTLAVGNKYLSIFIRTIDQLSYLFLPVSLLHFSLLFPIRKFDNLLKRFRYLYLFVILLSIPLFVINYYYIFHPSNNIFQIYEILNLYFIRPFVIPWYFGVLFVVVNSYFKSKNLIEKQKLLWIFVSIIWGPTMYIIMYLIPGLFLEKPFISESTMEILIIISPISLFIAIYKYSLFDIRMIIKRSFIYGFIFTIILISYLIILFISSEFLVAEKIQIQLSGLVTIVITIVMYQPVMSKIHKIVDLNFFKIDYDSNQSKSELTYKLNKSILSGDWNEIANNFLQNTLKINRYQILIYDKEKDDILSKINLNISLDQHQLYNLKKYIIQSNESIITGKPNVFSDVINFRKENELITMLNSELVFCSYNDEGIPDCILVVGRKNNGILYTSDDAELLVYFVNEIGNYFQKITFQKKLLFQIDEIKKLEELNQIKNYFISNVSHELKTPLTAISLFSELMLNNRNISLSNREEYLNIVIGECERLTRLINNLLDFSKIERGAKEYNFQVTDLNTIVNSVLKSTFYIMKLKKFKLNYTSNTEEFLIDGDSDALKEVFYNLIDNSIKYSILNKEISIKTYSENTNYIYEISDKGMGIKEENQKSIFDAYYRVKDSSTNGIGAGLIRS